MLHPLGEWGNSETVTRSSDPASVRRVISAIARELADDDVRWGTLEAVPFGPKPGLSFARLRDLTLGALAWAMKRELPDAKALLAERRAFSAQRKLEAPHARRPARPEPIAEHSIDEPSPVRRARAEELRARRRGDESTTCPGARKAGAIVCLSP